MIAAYERLHALGYAHSVEAWRDGELLGGLYGAALGRAFSGESMFHLCPEASRAATCGPGGVPARTGFPPAGLSAGHAPHAGHGRAGDPPQGIPGAHKQAVPVPDPGTCLPSCRGGCGDVFRHDAWAGFPTSDDEPVSFPSPSAYVPTGDQPEAIDSWWPIWAGVPEQILLGVTGSSKTFTMANVIARCGRPALVLAPNKTLAAQFYNEFREFFPQNDCPVFRQLRRLLPAGSLCARLGHLHRERFVHQR